MNKQINNIYIYTRVYYDQRSINIKVLKKKKNKQESRRRDRGGRPGAAVKRHGRSRRKIYAILITPVTHRGALDPRVLRT